MSTKTGHSPATITLAAGLLALAGADRALAADFTWINPAGGSFQTMTNWSPLGLPGAADNTLFNLAGPYTVTFAANAQSNFMNMKDGQATFDLGGFSYTIEQGYVGDLLLENGQLTLSNGTFTVTSISPLLTVFEIGQEDGATGHLTLTSTATFNSTETVMVGDAGDGTLDLPPGSTVNLGLVNLADDLLSNGTLSMTGPGTTWAGTAALNVGNGGNGVAMVSGGATLAPAVLRVADNDGSTGTFTLTGAGTTLTTTGAMVVANGGNGTATIDGTATATIGAAVRVGNDTLGVGTLTVDGIGASLSASGNAFIGNFGNGTMIIQNAAAASVGGLTRVGDNLGGSGDLTVTGAGTSYSGLNEVVIGNFGFGVVAVNDQATFSSTRIKVGDEIGATGTFTVDGAGTTVTDTIEIIVGNLGNGSMTISNGATVTSPMGSIGDNIGSSGDVTIDGPGSSWSNSISLANGDGGTASLSINDGGQASTAGPYVQTALATLNVELGPNSGNAVVAGTTATLSGTLNVTLAAGFTPASAATFTIVDAGSVLGTFATVNLPPDMTITYEPTAVIITAPGAACPADINGDGTVSITDLLALLAAWGTSPGGPPDFDGGGVGITDLLTLLSAWGACP